MQIEASLLIVAVGSGCITTVSFPDTVPGQLAALLMIDSSANVPDALALSVNGETAVLIAGWFVPSML
jgi:hypothetical protein